MNPRDLTPVVDALVRPGSETLGRHGVTAGMALAAGTIVCLAAGVVTATFRAGPWLMWVLLAGHLVWLGTLRLCDLLEREQHAGTARLETYREVVDRLAELALTWPLAKVAGLEAWLVTLGCLLALLTEIAGRAGGARRDDGPMDTTARLCANGLLCLLLGLRIGPGWWTSAWFQVLPFLLGWTMVRRLRAVPAEGDVTPPVDESPA